MTGLRRTLAAVALAAAVVACKRGTPPPSLQDIAAQWIEARNGERYGGVGALCDPDAIFWWPVSSPVLRGTDEIQQSLAGLKKTWKDTVFTSNGVFLDAPAGKVAIDWTVRAVDVATGQPVARQGIDVLEVRGGFVTAVRGFWDPAGLPTPLPSPRAGR